MAVTNLKDLDTNPQVIKIRHMIGNGVPTGDATLSNDTLCPINSTYLDRNSHLVYEKTASGDNWSTTTVKIRFVDAQPDGDDYDALMYPLDTIIIDKTGGKIYARVALDGGTNDFSVIAEKNA